MNLFTAAVAALKVQFSANKTEWVIYGREFELVKFQNDQTERIILLISKVVKLDNSVISWSFENMVNK